MKMHSGKYKCNLRHEQSHMLHVHDAAKTAIVELDSETESLEDYEEQIGQRISYEPPSDALKSTMMMLVEEVSESTGIFEQLDTTTVVPVVKSSLKPSPLPATTIANVLEPKHRHKGSHD